MKQAPVPALNQKGEDFQPAGGRNVAALQRMKVYNNFLYLRNSYVHHLPGVHWRNIDNTHFSQYSIGILDVS